MTDTDSNCLNHQENNRPWLVWHPKKLRKEVCRSEVEQPLEQWTGMARRCQSRKSHCSQVRSRAFGGLIQQIHYSIITVLLTQALHLNSPLFSSFACMHIHAWRGVARRLISLFCLLRCCVVCSASFDSRALFIWPSSSLPSHCLCRFVGQLESGSVKGKRSGETKENTKRATRSLSPIRQDGIKLSDLMMHMSKSEQMRFLRYVMLNYQLAQVFHISRWWKTTLGNTS